MIQELIEKIYKLGEVCKCENCVHYRESVSLRDCTFDNFGIFTRFKNRAFIRVEWDIDNILRNKEVCVCQYFEPEEELNDDR